MPKKKSVLFYLDNYTPSIKALSYEQKGMLFDAIISYAGGIADKPEGMGLLSLALDGITAAIDRDNEKYVQACEKNKKNGIKGGRPKKTQNNPVGLNGLKEKPNETHHNPKKPDTDTIQIRDDTDTKQGQEEILLPFGSEPEQKAPEDEFNGQCPAANKNAKLYHSKFEEFWEASPCRPNGSKGSKFNAFKAWWGVMRAKTLTPDEILAHMVRLAPTYGQYPKDVERWVKGAMWQGEASGAPRQPPKNKINDIQGIDYGEAGSF